LFVERALELGFQRYSLTEHGPVPPSVGGRSAGDAYTTPAEDVDRCLDEAHALSAEFADRVEVLPALEIDFIPGAEEVTADVVQRFGPRMRDGLLSVHFLPAADGFRMIDYSPEDFADGLVAHYGSVNEVHRAYWEAVRASALADFGPHTPRRLGHLGLVWKFRSVHIPENPAELDPVIDGVLDTIAERGCVIDIDAAGLRNPTCGQTMPAPDVLERARARGIPFVFGSDAHAVKHVGWGWDQVRPWLADHGDVARRSRG
jgi:histidinol-phosphatase (PHP family)